MALSDSRHGRRRESVSMREQQILDGMERGLGPTAIARELGVSAAYVGSIITKLNPSSNSDRAWNNMVQFGTEQLLAAIRRHHPDRCLAMRPDASGASR